VRRDLPKLLDTAETADGGRGRQPRGERRQTVASSKRGRKGGPRLGFVGAGRGGW
jgi:hypothetical protein